MHLDLRAANCAAATRAQNSARDRLLSWLVAGVGTLILLCFWFFFALQTPKKGWDFPGFYMAATLPVHEAYNRTAFAEYWQQHLAPLGVRHWSMFMRLPLFAVMIRPIAAVGYAHALWLWMGAGLVAYFASLAALMRRLQLPRLLLPAFVGFFPAIVGLISGQDNCFLLLGVTITCLLLEKKQEMLAGLALTLCLYKFNLVILAPLLLLLQRRYRALGSFAAGAVVVAGFSFVITPLRAYVTTLIEAPKHTPDFYPAGLRGFSLAIGQPWSYAIMAAVVLLLCCWAMWRLPLADAFCVAVTGGLLIVPYICWYDSTLLIIPLAVMYARGSTVLRAACVAVLILGPAWKFLVVHPFVELFVLGYFLRLAARARGGRGTCFTQPRYVWS